MKKILYIINVDHFFSSHFLEVGLEAIKKNYEVHIACSITNKKECLEKLGFIVHPLSIKRVNPSLKTEFKTIIDIYKILKSVNPQILEFFTIKPIIYGGLCSRLLNKPKKIFYFTGLGYVFIGKGLKKIIIRNIVEILYKIAIKGKNSLIITENIYDKSLINNLNIVENNQINIIRGAGVDLSEYKYYEEDNKDIKVTMACRLLKDKGVFEYLNACRVLKSRFPAVEFNLYGDIDIYNPASLTPKDIKKIKRYNFVNLHGFSSNIAKVFSSSNIVVLPSYREGLPRVLVEAASCGRAIVTSDVPGCRDAIEPGITGLLCNPKDFKSLSDAIEKLIIDNNLRNNMGKAGRKFAENEFDIKKIVKEHFEHYL